MTTDELGDFIADTMFTVGGTAWAEGPYYRDDSVTVYQGDCLDILKLLGDNSVDAVVTDPPYGINFMGKEWDGAAIQRSTEEHAATLETRGGYTPSDGRLRKRGAVGSRAAEAGTYDRSLDANKRFQRWCQSWAAECLRILKPGGHLLAFGGTRTAHRLACAVEDAGFEIRDSIAWLYGSGFPKSLDVSKAIDKAAGAEREVVGQRDRYRDGKERKNLGLRDNLYESGCSANGIADITTPATDAAKTWAGWGTALKPAHEPIIVARKPIQGTVAANVLAWGTGALNIAACRVAHANDADLAVSQSKNPGRDDSVTSGVYGADRPQQSVNTAGRWPPNVVLDGDTADMLDKQSGIFKGQVGMKADTPVQFGVGHQRAKQAFTRGATDEGGASRFFPTFRYTAKAPGHERPTADGTAHPTVKPVELIRWLIRLVTPPHGTVLDCFAGTGTTGEAAILEHMRCILIEREPTYLPLIVRRLHKPIQQGFDFDDGEELF